MATLADVESQLSEARRLEGIAGASAAKATTLPDLLGEAVRKKFGQENPLIQEREQQYKTFLGLPSRLPTAQQFLPQGQGPNVILDPLAAEDIRLKQRATALAPLTTSNFLLGQTYGGLADIVGAASRSYQAQVMAQQQAAQTARQSAQDAFELFKFQEQQRQAAAAAAAAAQNDLFNQPPAGGGQRQPVNIPIAFRESVLPYARNFNQAMQIINQFPNLTPQEKKTLTSMAQKSYQQPTVTAPSPTRPSPLEVGGRSALAAFLPGPLGSIASGLTSFFGRK